MPHIERNMPTSMVLKVDEQWLPDEPVRIEWAHGNYKTDRSGTPERHEFLLLTRHTPKLRESVAESRAHYRSAFVDKRGSFRVETIDTVAELVIAFEQATEGFAVRATGDNKPLYANGKHTTFATMQLATGADSQTQLVINVGPSVDELIRLESRRKYHNRHAA